MARIEEAQLFPKTALHEDHEEADYDSGCGCFRRVCCGWGNEERGEAWVAARLMKLRELTEVAWGPKWKNLVRKLGRVCNPRRCDKAAEQFQYSPESYALNFCGDCVEEEGSLLHSFSTRYARGMSVHR